jgi:SET domain
MNTASIKYLLVGTVAVLVSIQAASGSAPFDPVFSEKRLYSNLPCDIYLAPSKLGGWGVYAARDFERGEVVEVAPRYVTLKTVDLESNALYDFHYGFSYQRDLSDDSFGATIFGMTMFYNHGPGAKHNVLYTFFGTEPDKDFPWASILVGFTARRRIKRGEELLSSYGKTEQWFTARGLTMAEKEAKEDLSLSLEQLEHREHQYCRKTVAGAGQTTWIHRVTPTCEHFGFRMPLIELNDMLPLQDQPTAIAKEFVLAGHILEMAPAIIVPRDHMEVSPLAPMTLFWHDLDGEQQETIKQLRESGNFHLQARSHETGAMAYDVLEYFDDAAILPAAGNIGLVRKVGRDGADSNCRLEIAAAAESKETMDAGSSSLVLKLIATKDIQPGEELRLNLPDNSSWLAKMNLAQHLAITGQPIPKHLVDAYNPPLMSDPPHEVDQDL